MKSTSVKKPSDRKSLCHFTKILNVKKKTAKPRIGAEKYKLRATKVGNSLWTNWKSEKGIQNKLAGQT